ncbi:hypothetical protein EV363DRAFT_1166983 [Boletus edulis]|nr:hypothetical protein EV363DRAFT_1166983 [Boletus edulis]
MQQLRFLNSAKRKLSEKAQATLEDIPRKRQNDQGTTTAALKNLKNRFGLQNIAPPAKVTHATQEDSSSSTKGPPTPQEEESIHQGKDTSVSCQASICTEEEDDHIHRDTGVIVIHTDEEQDSSAKTGPEEELENLMKEWTSPVYAFFHSQPAIIDVDRQHAYNFKCAACGCKVKVRRYNGTKDARSMSNLRKHIKVCKGGGKRSWRLQIRPRMRTR